MLPPRSPGPWPDWAPAGLELPLPEQQPNAWAFPESEWSEPCYFVPVWRPGEEGEADPISA
eukprot:283480-Pyramimonas_sp.AAC.1